MKGWKIFLGKYEKAFSESFEHVASKKVTFRIWNKDYTLWGENPKDITDRLDWLEAPCRMQGMVNTVNHLAERIRRAGFARVVLLGMGGSSLAPLVFAEVFPKEENSLPLCVLDTTDPEEIRTCTEDPKTTLFVVSTKSGTTLETAVLFRYFYTLLKGAGVEEPGTHFVAITDPGSPLVGEAEYFHFRDVLCNNPNLGGRYSMFSLFGLFPGALLGVNLSALLGEAQKGMKKCFPDLPLEDNEGAILGIFLGSLALAGCDKVILSFPLPQYVTFGLWLEQLFAESTGKNGKGILPVVEKRLLALPRQDVAYIVFFENDDKPFTEFLGALERNGTPYIAIPIKHPYALGEVAYLFEFAVALSGYLLGINPFDQPDVELTKRFTREMLHSGERLLPENALQDGEVTLLWEESTSSLQEALKSFLGKLREDGYLTIQAFTHYGAALREVLESLAATLGEACKTVVSWGYGPRYLHSTGQLHKGDSGKGSFLQVITRSDADLPIPDEPGNPKSSLTFGTLKMAQALADRKALKERGRNVLTLIVPEKRAPGILRDIEASFRKP